MPGVPDFSQITLTIDGPVATITLQRPDALNAITPQMLAELDEATTEVADDASIRLVILTGAGRAFSAGVDLKSLGERELVDGKVGDLLDLPARRVTTALSTMAKPVIAKVNGFCFTGALELALACDLIVVADEAKLGDTHAKWGLRPTWGMSQRLPHRVGPTRARLLSYTARTFSGSDAAAWGLAAASVPGDRLDATVDELVEEILSNSSDAFVAYKDLYRVAEQSDLASGLAYEATTDYSFTDTDARLSGFR